MFDRLKLIFTPTAPPAGASKKWSAVQRECERWGMKRRQAQNVWMDNTKDIKSADLPSERKNLLTSAVTAGKTARKSLLRFEQLYRPSIQKAHQASSFDPPQDPFSSRVYLSRALMQELDEVYIDHYCDDENRLKDLHRCFETMGSVSAEGSEWITAYERYVEDVEKRLQHLAKVLETQPAAAWQGLTAANLNHSAEKVKPLLWPVFGRLCLPLPTPSMLEDFRPVLEIGNEVMKEVSSFTNERKQQPEPSQVGRWFDGLGQHIVTTRGHCSETHTWSEVIALRLKSLCPCQELNSVREEFNLWVSLTFLFQRST